MDLTQNPKDAAKDIGGKVQQATPDVGANPFDDIIGQVGFKDNCKLLASKSK